MTELFTNEHCEFYFLNAYNYGISGLNAIEMLQADDEWFEKPKDESIQQLGKLVERYTLKSKNTKHEFNAISDCMNLTDSIKKNVEEINIDLIILTGRAQENLGKNTESILKKVRTCPILVVPPHASMNEGIHLSIVSDFKEQNSTVEIHNFIKALENTNIQIEILVLKHSKMSSNAAYNLESYIRYLRHYLSTSLYISHLESTNDLLGYTKTYPDAIVCIIDKKPDFFRKMGLLKSKVLSTLRKLNTNTVLTVHQ